MAVFDRVVNAVPRALVAHPSASMREDHDEGNRQPQEATESGSEALSKREEGTLERVVRRDTPGTQRGRMNADSLSTREVEEIVRGCTQAGHHLIDVLTGGLIAAVVGGSVAEFLHFR